MDDISLKQGVSMASLKKTLLWLIFVLNFIGGVVTFPLFSMATNAGKLIILSTYREFDIEGLVNRKAVQEYDNGRFAGEWTEIPDYLGEEAFRYVLPVAFGISVVFILNAIVLDVLIGIWGLNAQPTDKPSPL